MNMNVLYSMSDVMLVNVSCDFEKNGFGVVFR